MVLFKMPVVLPYTDWLSCKTHNHPEKVTFTQNIHIGGSCHDLEGIITHRRYPKCPPDSFLRTSTWGLHMIQVLWQIQSVGKDSVKHSPTPRRCLVIPIVPEHALTHWALCFVGLPPPEDQKERTNGTPLTGVVISFYLICLSVTLFLSLCLSSSCFLYLSISDLLLNKFHTIDFDMWSY